MLLVTYLSIISSKWYQIYSNDYLRRNSNPIYVIVRGKHHHLYPIQNNPTSHKTSPVTWQSSRSLKNKSLAHHSYPGRRIRNAQTGVCACAQHSPLPRCHNRYANGAPATWWFTGGQHQNTLTLNFGGARKNPCKKRFAPFRSCLQGVEKTSPPAG